jgi:hypothetical protein
VRVIHRTNSVPSSGRVSRKDMQLRLARLAAIERSLSRYLHLTCGHYQTLETFDQYLVFRPKKGWTFCENCNENVEIAKPPKRPPLPEEPMF